MKPLHLAASLALMPVLLACSPASPPQPQPPLVTSYTLPYAEGGGMQRYPAVVRAADLTSLSFRVNGLVKQLKVIEGQRIRQGELLATLNPRDFEIKLNDVKAKLELAKSRVARGQQLLAKGNFSQSNFDELKAQLSLAQAEFDYAQHQLSYTQLKAPFDGVISLSYVRENEAIQIAQPVVQMHRADRLEIVVELPDALFALRPKGAQTPIVIPVRVGDDPQSYDASYYEHTERQDEAKGTFSVVLSMPPIDGRLILPGTPASVAISSTLLGGDVASFDVPVEAVRMPDDRRRDGEPLVWRLVGEGTDATTVEAVNVRVVRISNTMVKVTGALRPGERLITAGFPYLRNGSEVRLIPADAEIALAINQDAQL
ncbi:MAG: efflux RND transporter periplasmic adaptor subunit [Gammaproteobacteria bacterium]|nr:efflux RND transporter periplasmic adaptor subunit [Gammaproteobacteria bacterium]